jgi:hypothetical protein
VHSPNKGEEIDSGDEEHLTGTIEGTVMRTRYECCGVCAVRVITCACV